MVGLKNRHKKKSSGFMPMNPLIQHAGIFFMSVILRAARLWVFQPRELSRSRNVQNLTARSITAFDPAHFRMRPS